MPIALQAVLPEELARLAGIDPGDARRIVSLVHRTGELPLRAPATVRRAALDRVRAIGHVPSLEIVDRAASKDDPFVKLVVGLEGGAKVETVRIPLEKPGRFSVCVSSQVGCALACAFCATGRLGLVRNLETWEIVEQVRLVRSGLARPAERAADADPRPAGRVHGVVFQGMGEPLANADRVIAAIRVLSDPSALAIDQRNITVTTAGLPSGIRRLARELPRVRLGVSIGDARRGRRRGLMPIDDRHALEETLEAAGEHAQASGYSPMFAYTLLAGDNDDREAALALAALVRRFTEAHGKRPRLSLIPFNPIDDLPSSAPSAAAPADRPRSFARQSDRALAAFRDVLRAEGVPSIVRYSGGADVGAACGQLSARSELGAPPRRRSTPAGP